MPNIRYHKSFSFTSNGEQQKLITQLYKTGVYGIWNSDPSLQGNYTPQQLSGMGKKLLSAEKSGEISNVELGPIIIVSDKSGFWEEVLQK